MVARLRVLPSSVFVFDLAEVEHSVRELSHKFPFRGQLDVPWAIRKCRTLSYDDFPFAAKAFVHSKLVVNLAVLSHLLVLNRACLGGWQAATSVVFVWRRFVFHVSMETMRALPANTVRLNCTN